MSEHRADTALRTLAELRVPEPLAQVEARQRREIVEHLERMQYDPPPAEPRRRLFWLSAAALVSIALGIALFVLSSAGPVPKVAEKSAVQPPPIVATGVEQMTMGSEVKTDAGSSAQLRTSLGARISVGGSSELRLAEGQQSGSIERVELSSGSIRVKVPKLGPNRQFRVSTPDTLVIVHGTEFSVTVRNDAQGRPNTVVEVKSGRVEVRKKQAVEFLDAGAAWSSEKSFDNVPSEQRVAPRPKQPAREAPSASGAPPSAASSDAPREEPVALTPAPVAPPQSVPEPGGGEPPGGSLVRANALLRSALEASRKGNDQLALTRLDELLRRYPDSPVADNAKVERFRVLKRLGRERDAARAASGYLEGDPDGFARDEARTLGK